MSAISASQPVQGVQELQRTDSDVPPVPSNSFVKSPILPQEKTPPLTLPDGISKDELLLPLKV